MRKNVLLIVGLCALVFTSCENELDFEAKGLVTEQQLIDLGNSSPEASLLINQGVEDGQYAFLRQFATNFEDTGSRHDDFGQKSIDLGVDLLGNDMVQVQDHWFGNYYSYRGRTQDFSTTRIVANLYYSVIANVNSIITQIDPDVGDIRLKHLRARAMALRAYSYLYLVRFYQYTYQGNESAPGMPLYDGGDINITSRAPLQQMYDLMIADIDWAYNNITGYVRPSKEKLDKNVIAGIYARILLESGTDWAKCAQLAAEVKASWPLMSNAAYVGEGFSLISNNEWGWGADINAESSTIYASFFSHVATTNPGYAGLLGIYKSIDKRLYDAIPATDIRKSLFSDGSTYPLYANLKFRDFTFFEGDYVYMRSSEMYLMEAEALARSGSDAQAAQVLYQLVSVRDAGYTLSTNTGQALIDEILLQRRIELWGEGFGWFDIKRTKGSISRTYPGTNHVAFGLFDFGPTDSKFLFQIPEGEINNNPDINAVDQNPL